MTENNGETHGYRWSDGSVRQHPEPKDKPVNKHHEASALAGREATAVLLKAPTEAQYAKAYAEWVKAFTAWQAKYGDKL